MAGLLSLIHGTGFGHSSLAASFVDGLLIITPFSQPLGLFQLFIRMGKQQHGMGLRMILLGPFESNRFRVIHHPNESVFKLDITERFLIILRSRGQGIRN